MANIMQMLKLSNHVTRDGYDLQKRLSFTAKPGEKLPIYSRYLMPNDVFDIDAVWKTRTAYLNSSAMTRFKEYCDWYIVPIDILWNKFNNWFTNNKEQMQSANSIRGNVPLADEHPYFTVMDLQYCVDKFKGMEDSPGGRNAFGFSRYQLTCKLLHYLGYGDYYQEVGEDGTPNLSRHLTNAKLSPWKLLAYQCIYAHFGRYEQWEAIRPETFNIDYLQGSEEQLQVPIREIFYNNVYANGTGTSMLEMRYANWHKDMFMGLLPSAQYGDEATVDLSSLLDPRQSEGMGIYNSVTNSTNVGTSASGALTANDYGIWYLKSSDVSKIATALGLTSENLQSAFTILALRQAEARQKYLEIKQSNKYDFPSQVDAHFGTRPSNAYSRMPIHLGSWDNVVGIADVENTNLTENSDGSLNAPRVAGKALGRGQGKKIKYKGDVPAILMCIYHVKPLLDYALPRIDPDNLKVKFTDYPLPEFDRTGMQQVPLAWLMNRIPKLEGMQDGSFGSITNLLGYAPPYLDCKTDIDEVKGGFYNGGIELQSWVAPITSQYASNWFVLDGNFAVFNGLNSNFFRVNPKVLNPIFVTEMDDTVQSDKFWVEMNFFIDAVRPLDRQGLPY